MEYEQYVEKFRNWQMEKDERVFEKPMTESEFSNWVKPTEETAFSRQEKLTYKEMYLRLRKLCKDDEMIKKIDDAFKPAAEKLDLI